MANRCSCHQLRLISSFAVASFVSASRYGGPGRCQSAQLPAQRATLIAEKSIPRAVTFAKSHCVIAPPNRHRMWARSCA